DEHHDGGRLAGGLRSITELQPPALEARGRMLEERLAQDSIQLVWRHLDPALPDHLKGRRQEGPDAFPRLRRDRRDGCVRSELEVPREGRTPVGRLALDGLD